MPSAQGSRSRVLTLHFERSFHKVARLIAPSNEDGFFHVGPYQLNIEGDKYQLYHEGDLIAAMGRGRQYGSARTVLAVIAELGEDVNKGLTQDLDTMAKGISSRLATLMSGVYKEHPDAGYSVLNDKLVILKNKGEPERTHNILYEIPLLGVVRAIV